MRAETRRSELRSCSNPEYDKGSADENRLLCLKFGIAHR